MIHTILFDIGGTLLNSSNLFQEIAIQLNPNLEKEITLFLVTQFKKLYNNKEPNPFLTITNMLEKSIELASKKYNTKNINHLAYQFHRESFITKGTTFNDTIQTLRELKKRKITLIAVTDADHQIMIGELKHFNIHHFFDQLLISSQIRAYKPSDKFISQILSVCKKPLEKILVIGDSIVDIQTAEKLNAKSVLIDRRKSMKFNPTYRIRTLREILKIL